MTCVVPWAYKVHLRRAAVELGALSATLSRPVDESQLSILADGRVRVSLRRLLDSATPFWCAV
jgi:hypothetical protein